MSQLALVKQCSVGAFCMENNAMQFSWQCVRQWYPALILLCLCQVAFLDMQAKETAGQAYDYTQVCAFLSKLPWEVSLGHLLRNDHELEFASIGMLAGLHLKSANGCCSRAAAAALPWFMCMLFRDPASHGLICAGQGWPGIRQRGAGR